MAVTLQHDVNEQGYWDADLVKVLQNLRDVVNELQTDIGTVTAAVDGIVAKLDGDAGITDTNYEAVHGLGGSGAALPAALTNSTAITLAS